MQIFSMGIVFMLLLSPLKNVAGMNQGTWLITTVVVRSVLDSAPPVAFAPFAPSSSPSEAKSWTTLPLQKAVYILCNILTLGVGLWKCRSMGLLPTGTGDWLAFETRGTVSVQVLSAPYRETDDITRRRRYLCFDCTCTCFTVFDYFGHHARAQILVIQQRVLPGNSSVIIARSRVIPMLVSNLQRCDANADTNARQ